MDCEYAVENGGCLAESKLLAKADKQITSLVKHISYAIGRLDIVPQTNEGNLCVEVKNYLENAIEETRKINGGTQTVNELLDDISSKFSTIQHVVTINKNMSADQCEKIIERCIAINRDISKILSEG